VTTPYPAGMDGRVRLSAGPPVAGRVIGVVAGVIFALVGTAFAVLPLVADHFLRGLGGGSSCDGMQGLPPNLMPPDLQRCADLPDLGADGLGPVRFVGLVGVPLALIGLYFILRMLRTAFWLDGTTLTARRTFGRRAVDLATAELNVETVIQRTTDDGHLIIKRVPTLFARDPQTGRRVTLALKLPAGELRWLAQLISVNVRARPVADQVNQLATR
jgi:hypothetical protein